MVKNIKKSLKYFIIVIGILIILPTFLYLVLQISEVQTFLVNRVTNHISKEAKSVISFGRIEFKFFNKLTINDILIKDMNNDTLLYSEKVIAVIKKVDLKNNSFRLGRVTLINPAVELITDSSGIMNLTSLIDFLKKPENAAKNKKSKFSIDQIDISDASFSLIDHSKAPGKTKMDFNNLKLTQINGIIEDLKIESDTTTFNIYNLGFNEKSGFSVNRMSSSVKLANRSFQLNSTFLNCDSSIINITKLGLFADSSSSFKSFSEKVRLDILLGKSLIYSSDLQYFIPQADGLNESVRLSGKIYGTIAELRGRNIELFYRDNTNLYFDFDFSGLPEIENAFIYIGINSLNTNAKDLENLRLPGKGRIIIPEFLYRLGNISFDGSFTGFTTDFVTYGELRTEVGNIRTDISLRPEESKKYRIKGLLKGNDIDLGNLTGKPQLLGKLSMSTNVDGYAFSFEKFAANLTGKIDSVEIKGYKYRNVELNGFFTEKTWDGSVKIIDKNISLDLLGMFNFKEKLPEFDFTLNIAGANLYNLNIDKLDTTSSVTLLLTSNFKGNSIDNLDGEIKLLNSSFIKYNTSLELYDFSIRTYTESNNHMLSLRTDFVDADIRGYYNFAVIGNLIKSTLSTLMPSQFVMPVQRNDLKKNNFIFEINFKNTDKINSFFRTGLLLADKSFIKGAVFPDSVMRIGGKAALMTLKNNVLKDFSFDADVSGSDLSVEMNSTSLILLGQSEIKGLNVALKTRPDNFTFTVDWDNKDKILNRGNFVARGTIEKNTSGKGLARLMVDIDSTAIYSRNNLWMISNSKILIDSNTVNINELYVRNKDRYYLINGTVSENPSDTLHLQFKGIDISPLNFIGNQSNFNDPNKIPLDIKGTINGRILLTNVYSEMLLESNIIINNFSILGSEYGNISIVSAWDKARRVAKITASNNFNGVKMFDAAGIYDPATSKIDITGTASKLPVAFLNPLLKVFASDITGLATGKVNLSGQPKNLVLKGAVMAEKAFLKINYLQTKYSMNDTIRFDKNGFKFNNIKLTDEKGNTATLTGSVNHKNFHDYVANLVINTNELQVLNTKPKDNNLFYGTAYASGVTTIKSGPNSISFDISARTGKNTRIFIPLNTSLSVSEYSFITFADSASMKESEGNPEETKSVPQAVKKTGMELNFDLDITPDAEVQIIFDSRVGDVMKGRGSSKLNITLNKKGEFRMTGDYIIDEGDYLFTLGNILNKSFSVENGGRITFNGDLDNAEIDIKAIYRLRASLFDILQDEIYKERIPVECQLNLSGKLFNPVIGFNIFLPTADEQTRTYLRNRISTEEELSRQFLYLLVMNSFYADQSSGTGLNSTTTGTSAMAVTTTEMLSNQLSNWLSQISNKFDLGFLYRPGDSDINPQEVEFALSTQLLNDKVIINGNFDVRGTGNNSSNTDQITGDFDAEVKITEKIRFKVFNRFNDIYTGKGPYTQGIGIFYKQDFDKFSDLFRKKVKPDMKKEEETTIKEK